MNSNFKRIAIEGGEGSGKSTLIQLLKENLDLNDNVFFREPYLESSVAAQFEAWRLGLLELDEIEEVELFAQARKELNHDKIIPALAEGKTVWQDRSIVSSLVYQGELHSLSRNEILGINIEKDSEFKLPDLVILLDAQPLYLQDRMKENDREMDELDKKPLWFHQQIRDGFLALEKDLPCEFLILDALKSAEENLSIVLDFLKNNKKN